MVFGNLGLPPGTLDIPIFNASTGTAIQFMVMVGGNSKVVYVNSVAGGVDMPDGKIFVEAVPVTTARASEVVGIAQETIPPLTLGTIRLFGASFVRTAQFQANKDDILETQAAAGLAGNTTGGAKAFFYVSVTGSRTFTFGSKVTVFTETHAYGFVNVFPTCYRLNNL